MTFGTLQRVTNKMSDNKKKSEEYAAASEETGLRAVGRFIVGAAYLAHSSAGWETMLQNLLKGIQSINYSAASPQVRDIVDNIDLFLPQMEEILKEFYDTNKEVMLKRLQEFVNYRSVADVVD
jgi:hypothetical protein